MPEVSRGKVHINQKKNVPIEFDCDLLNTSHSLPTSHSTSHATLFCWWLEKGSLEEVHCCLTAKYYSILQSTTQYYSVLQRIIAYNKVHQSTNYSALRSTTPYNTQCYSILQITRPYLAVLQSTKQYYSALQSITPYCAVLQKHYKVRLRTTKNWSVW